jgi:hypothetical protein
MLAAFGLEGKLRDEWRVGGLRLRGAATGVATTTSTPTAEDAKQLTEQVGQCDEYESEGED